MSFEVPNTGCNPFMEMFIQVLETSGIVHLCYCFKFSGNSSSDIWNVFKSVSFQCRNRRQNLYPSYRWNSCTTAFAVVFFVHHLGDEGQTSHKVCVYPKTCHNGSNDFTNHEEDSIRQSLFGRINDGLVTITAELCQDLLSFCLSAVFHNNAHHLRFYNLHESVWTTEILSCEKQFHLSTQFAIFLGFPLHFYPIWNIILYWLSAPCTNNCYVATIAWINTYWEVLKTKCKICVTQGKKT